MRRQYEQTIAAADRTAGHLTWAAGAVEELEAVAAAAREEGQADAAKEIDDAAVRVRQALGKLVLVALQEAVKIDPHGVVDSISRAADVVNKLEPSE